MRRFRTIIATFLAVSISLSPIATTTQAAKKLKAPKISATKKTLRIGKTTKLSIKKNGVKKIKTTTWKVNKKSIVTLKAKKKNSVKVIAKQAGSAKITAKVKYQIKGSKKLYSKKLTCKIIVKAEDSNKPSITKTPSVTQKPVITNTPVITPEPVVTDTPQITQSPVVEPTPIVVVTPQPTIEPVTPTEPVITPEETVAPVIPDITPEPSIPSEPDEPTVTDEPVINTPEPSETTNPDISETPEPSEKIEYDYVLTYYGTKYGVVEKAKASTTQAGEYDWYVFEEKKYECTFSTPVMDEIVTIDNVEYGVTIKEPKCTETGSKYYYDLRNGVHCDTESIPATGHTSDEIWHVSMDSNGETGDMYNSCISCESHLNKISVYFSENEYTYTEWIQEPSGTQEGIMGIYKGVDIKNKTEEELATEFEKLDVVLTDGNKDTFYGKTSYHNDGTPYRFDVYAKSTVQLIGTLYNGLIN